MDRLTERKAGYVSEICENCPRHARPCFAENCLEVMSGRLADYEDTGLEPQEIQEAVDLFKDWRDADIPKELKSWVERCTWHVRRCEELRRELNEYEKAKAEGRLIVLPPKDKQTKADMIRTMTNEELADFWVPKKGYGKAPWCKPVGRVKCSKGPCDECALEWLRQQAEGGEQEGAE